MRAKREITSALTERYRAGRRLEKGRILDELCAVTGWHRKHAIRALSVDGASASAVPRRRSRTYGASIRVALIVLWDASDRLCSKRLVAMIPFLLPALERHGRLKLSADERSLVLKVSAATIDRLLSDVKIAAAGGRRRRAGFSSAVRRQVPVRTFNDWGSPPPGYCEADLVAHGGMSVSGAFVQTLTMVPSPNHRKPLARYSAMGGALRERLARTRGNPDPGRSRDPPWVTFSSEAI